MGLAELFVERHDVVDHAVLVEGDEASSTTTRVERVGDQPCVVLVAHRFDARDDDVAQLVLRALLEPTQHSGVIGHVLLQARAANTRLDVGLEIRVFHTQLGLVAVLPQRAQGGRLAGFEHLHLRLAGDLAVGDVLGGRSALGAIDRLGPARRVDGRRCRRRLRRACARCRGSRRRGCRRTRR